MPETTETTKDLPARSVELRKIVHSCLMAAMSIEHERMVGRLSPQMVGEQLQKTEDRLFELLRDLASCAGTAWISVEERLPQDGESVWVAVWAWDDPKRNERSLGHATFSAPARWIGIGSENEPFDWYTPTHWSRVAPLPAAPTSTPSAAKKD